MQNGIFKKGDICGACRVLSFLGSGGMAEVYKAMHLERRETVALKVLRPFYASNRYVTEHMLAEAELLSKINHQNVVHVNDVGEHKGLLWMEMEFLSGMTLRALLKRRGALPIPKALYYSLEIADGISAAHELHVIHRDLKPENVMVTEEDKVKVLDLGTAKFLTWDNVSVTQPGMAFGTPLYMAPEHIQGDPLDARCDIYSLGLMLYEMLAGYHPFEKPGGGKIGIYELGDKQCRLNPPTLASVREGIPMELSDLVKRAIAKDRSQRPSAMSELAQAFRASLRALDAAAARREPAVAVVAGGLARDEAARKGFEEAAVEPEPEGAEESGEGETKDDNEAPSSSEHGWSSPGCDDAERDDEQEDSVDDSDGERPTLTWIRRTAGASSPSAASGVDDESLWWDEGPSAPPDIGPNGTIMMESGRAQEHGVASLELSAPWDVPEKLPSVCGDAARESPGWTENRALLAETSFKDRLIQQALWAFLGGVMFAIAVSFIYLRAVKDGPGAGGGVVSAVEAAAVADPIQPMGGVEEGAGQLDSTRPPPASVAPPAKESPAAPTGKPCADGKKCPSAPEKKPTRREDPWDEILRDPYEGLGLPKPSAPKPPKRPEQRGTKYAPGSI